MTLSNVEARVVQILTVSVVLIIFLSRSQCWNILLFNFQIIVMWLFVVVTPVLQ